MLLPVGAHINYRSLLSQLKIPLKVSHIMLSTLCKSFVSTSRARTIIVTLLVFSVFTQHVVARHILRKKKDPNWCVRKFTPMLLHIKEGCEPRLMNFPYCSGVGFSYSRSTFTAPLRKERCTCCASISHKVTKRTLTFVCGGRNETHSVFFQKISDCGLVECSTLID